MFKSKAEAIFHSKFLKFEGWLGVSWLDASQVQIFQQKKEPFI